MGVYRTDTVGPDALIAFAWGVGQGDHVAYDIGASAAELILGRIADVGEPIRRVLPTELVVRGSTAPPPPSSARAASVR